MIDSCEVNKAQAPVEISVWEDLGRQSSNADSETQLGKRTSSDAKLDEMEEV